MENNFYNKGEISYFLRKPLRCLRIILFCLFVTSIVQANGAGTAEQVNNIRKSTLLDFFKTIEEETEYVFIYSKDIQSELKQVVSADIAPGSIPERLPILFENTNLTYQVNGKQVIVKRKADASNIPIPGHQQARRQITGTVIDDTGEPVIGANIVEKGTTNGITTDKEGKFILSVAENAVLLISYIGYIGQEIAVGSGNHVHIILKEDTQALEEVVVIGYGTLRKSDLTGSVSEISAGKLKDIPLPALDQQLVGKVAGVQIQQVSGAPGAGTSIKIRGSGSLGAGNEPLYVIDGMPYSSEMSQTLNPLVFINPGDIESISILKDASSTAIYGSRGANGVILFTTKSANKDKDEINVSFYLGVNQVPQKGRPEMMNAQEFALYQRDHIGRKVRNTLNREPVESDYPIEYQNVDAIGKGTNWYDLVLRNAIVQNYDINLQKSVNRSLFYFGVNYAEQEGVVYNTGLQRFSANMKYTFNYNDRFWVDASLRPSYIEQDRITSGTGRSDPLGIALWANPVTSPYSESGELIPFITTPVSGYSGTWTFPNPLFMLEESKRKYNEVRNLGNLALQWEVISGLRVKSALSTIYNNTNYNQFVPSTVGSPNAAPRVGRGAANRARGNSFNWLLENTVNYNKIFGKHSIAAVAGHTIQKSRSQSLSLNAGPYDNDLIETINVAQGITSWSESISEWSIISYLGRLNYTFDHKYLFTATIRSDGSSRFGPDNRYATFPSAAIAWRASEENFLKQVKEINQLKFRMSYGKSGNNNIGNYAHLPTVSMTQYVFDDNATSAATISLSNPYLGWEESEQYDLGLDLSLFQDRIIFTADLYTRKSVNMLLNDMIPSITGFTSQLVNKGSVRNKGLELSVDGYPFRGAFTWNAGFNIAFNRNKVLSTNENRDHILSGDVDGRASNISMVGKPIGQFYGFVLEGVYSEEDIANPNVPKYASAVAGYPKYKDLNGDGVISEILDYTALGSPHPDFTFGINSTMNYKNVDFSFNLTGRKGGYIVNGLRQTTDNLQGFFNIGKEWVNRWRSTENPGDGIHAGGPNAVHRLNDQLWLEDASYFRISNITLGYTFPVKNIGNGKIFKYFRIYVTAQNLHTFTDYKGANPEGQASNVDNTLSPGIDNNAYPLPRVLTAGVNIKF